MAKLVLDMSAMQEDFFSESALIGISAAMPDQPPPYAAIATFDFESVQAFGEAVMPHYKELQGDIPNYTDIEPAVHRIPTLRMVRLEMFNCPEDQYQLLVQSRA